MVSFHFVFSSKFVINFQNLNCFLYFVILAFHCNYYPRNIFGASVEGMLWSSLTVTETIGYPIYKSNGIRQALQGTKHKIIFN